MSERFHPLRLLERALVVAGFVESPEEFRARIAFERETRRERDKQRHMVLEHSDAGCTSETEYLLGLSNYDPHPDHPITFTPCNCEGREEGYLKEESAPGLV